MLVTSILLENPNISLIGLVDTLNDGRHPDSTQLRMLTIRLKAMVCVAMPQYAMPLRAITTPMVPDTRSETSPMMVSSFCFICFIRMALGTMLNEAMKKPKK